MLGEKNQVVSQSTVTAVTGSDLPRVQGKVSHTVILNEVKKCLPNVRVKARRRLKKNVLRNIETEFVSMLTQKTGGSVFEI